MEAITLDEIHGAESMLEDGEVLEIVIRLEDII